MIKITLPDGSVKEFNSGITPAEVALSISEGLARNVLSAAFNGKTIETVTPLTTDGSLVLYTWENPEGKKAFWHSSAHILAQANLLRRSKTVLSLSATIAPLPTFVAGDISLTQAL